MHKYNQLSEHHILEVSTQTRRQLEMLMSLLRFTLMAYLHLHDMTTL